MKADAAPARLDPAEAWKPWKPDAAQPWSPKWAGHLLRRAAFAPSWEELQQAIKDGPEATVDRLLAGGEEADDFDALADDAARGLAASTRNDTFVEYQALWIYRMVQTPAPLRERMTLFWHNHFATGVAKVRQPGLMQKQNALIRKHALGKFAPFLLEMSRDPAMLIWLDSNSNRKGKANENYAREVMELFSLGVGNYTEKDVQDAARAFTGWHTDGGVFVFNERLHDDGDKTILEQKGNWDGGDVIRIVLEQPAAGRFLARKLYRHFISENAAPAEPVIEALAEQIRKSDYDMRAAVRTVLRRDRFFSAQAYRQRVKSPIELVVGLVRSLGGARRRRRRWRTCSKAWARRCSQSAEREGLGRRQGLAEFRDTAGPAQCWPGPSSAARARRSCPGSTPPPWPSSTAVTTRSNRWPSCSTCSCRATSPASPSPSWWVTSRKATPRMMK